MQVICFFILFRNRCARVRDNGFVNFFERLILSEILDYFNKMNFSFKKFQRQRSKKVHIRLDWVVGLVTAAQALDPQPPFTGDGHSGTETRSVHDCGSSEESLTMGVSLIKLACERDFLFTEKS